MSDLMLRSSHWVVHEVALAPRSAYLLAGEARTAWQHSTRPVTETRYSVTFRTLASPSG